MTEKEIAQMKAVVDDINENFDSAFKSFLSSNNEATNPYTRFKKYNLCSEAKYIFNKINLPIKSKSDSLPKFTVYQIFEAIDLLSKEYIISELKPKKQTIFLGQNSQIYNLLEKLRLKKISCEILSSGKSESIKFYDNLLPVKFDSTILQKLPIINIKDYGIVYNLQNTLLRVKTKRDFSISEASLCLKENLNNESAVIESSLAQDSTANFSFFTKGNLKLININREISKALNEKFFIIKNKITNLSQDFVLYLDEKNELVLQGSLNPIYLKVKNFVTSNLINLEDN